SLITDRVRTGEAMKWSCSLDETEGIVRPLACTFHVGGARMSGLRCPPSLTKISISAPPLELRLFGNRERAPTASSLLAHVRLEADCVAKVTVEKAVE